MITEVDIYSNKLELDTQEAMIKADEILAMIGCVTVTNNSGKTINNGTLVYVENGNCQCAREAEKEGYSRINWDLVGRNVALESMLDASKKENLELKEKVASLREQLSNLQKVR